MSVFHPLTLVGRLEIDEELRGIFQAAKLGDRVEECDRLLELLEVFPRCDDGALQESQFPSRYVQSYLFPVMYPAGDVIAQLMLGFDSILGGRRKASQLPEELAAVHATIALRDFEAGSS